MSERFIPAGDDRSIAIYCYNRAQDLYHSIRTTEQDQEMLEMALTSKTHWQLVGGPQEFAMSDWMVSRVYVLLKDPALAIEYALGSLVHDQEGFPTWLKASVFEGVARAHKYARNDSEFLRFRGLAVDALSLETDLEDKKFIMQQIQELSN